MLFNSIVRFIPHTVLSQHVSINTVEVLSHVKEVTQSDSVSYHRCDIDLPDEGNNFTHIELVNPSCEVEVIYDLANSFASRPVWSEQVEIEEVIVESSFEDTEIDNWDISDDEDLIRGCDSQVWDDDLGDDYW